MGAFYTQIINSTTKQATASETVSLSDEGQALALWEYPGVRVNVADPTLNLSEETNVGDWVSSAIMIDTARGVMKRIVSGWGYYAAYMDDFYT